MKLLVYGYGILIYLVLVYFLRVWSLICDSFRFLKLFLESLYVLLKVFCKLWSELFFYLLYLIKLNPPHDGWVMTEWLVKVSSVPALTQVFSVKVETVEDEGRFHALTTCEDNDVTDVPLSMALRLMSLALLKSLVLSAFHSSLLSSSFESLQTSQPGL